MLSRNQGAVAAAVAERTGAAARLEAARLTAQSEIAAARSRDDQARRALDAYSADVIALARQNLDAVRQTYDLGRGTLLDVLNEQRRYLDVERAYTDVLREAYEAREMSEDGIGRNAMSTSRVTVAWPALIAGGIGLLAAGAGIAYVAVRPAPATSSPQSTAPGAVRTPASASPSVLTPGGSPDVVVTLTPEAIQRAGIVLAPVSAGRDTSTLRLPGVVEPNAYKQVAVTPLVGGRVTRVLAELGQSVRRGQPLAEIFSPELAEAETRSSRPAQNSTLTSASCNAPRSWSRSDRASRQELERLHAEHAAKLDRTSKAPGRGSNCSGYPRRRSRASVLARRSAP